MAVITTGNFPKLLEEGLDATFGLAYSERPQQWSKIFSVYDSYKNREEDVALTGLGIAPRRPEGDATSYDSMQQAWVVDYTHVDYGIGYVITQNAIEDNLYADVGVKQTKACARSIHQTQEIVCANVMNQSFTAGAYAGGDGVAMISASHPTAGGLLSNTLSTAAPLSEAVLEQLLIDIHDARDNRNLRMYVQGKSLLVPAALKYTATRILRNPDRPGTADRDINAMYSMGDLPGGMIVNNYLTSDTAFWILTDIEDGLKYFNRRTATFSRDNEFDTDNLKFKATIRFSAGFSDWRCAWGTQGT